VDASLKTNPDNYRDKPKIKIMSTSTETQNIEKIFPQAEDFLPLLGTDYVEFYVGNAKQSAVYYKNCLGFQTVAYAGLETGVKDRTSYVLQQGKIRIVLTTPMGPEGEIAEHINLHGDGVKVIALWVDDATKSFEETTKRGAKPYMKPTTEKDEFGEVVRSGIHTYGDTVHLFVERKTIQVFSYQDMLSKHLPSTLLH